jgi:hypothetical protein
MIRHILVIIFFSGLLFSCNSDKQEKVVETTETFKTENSQSRFCLISSVKEENQKAILIFDLIEKRKYSLNSESKIIELPNGFYFSNTETKLEAIEMDSNSVLILQTFSFNDDGNFKFNQKVNITDFVKVFTYSKNSRYKMLPFRIVTTGTRIDSLFEIYIP